MEIPKSMQRQYGFKPLGPATGPVKAAILGRNSARIYAYEVPTSWSKVDRSAALKEDYRVSSGKRTNQRYGYVKV